jgi:hypothetical protein
MARPSFLPLFTQRRGRGQRVEKVGVDQVGGAREPENASETLRKLRIPPLDRGPKKARRSFSTRWGILRSSALCRGVSRSSVVDRNICHFMWYGGVQAVVLGRVGRKPSPHPRACALSCPSPTIRGPGSLGHGHLTRPAVLAHNPRRYRGHSPSGSPGPIGAARCGHSRRRELRVDGVLRNPLPEEYHLA